LNARIALAYCIRALPKRGGRSDAQIILALARCNNLLFGPALISGSAIATSLYLAGLFEEIDDCAPKLTISYPTKC
jgi:hypothetical protein